MSIIAQLKKHLMKYRSFFWKNTDICNFTCTWRFKDSCSPFTNFSGKVPSGQYSLSILIYPVPAFSCHLPQSKWDPSGPCVWVGGHLVSLLCIFGANTSGLPEIGTAIDSKVLAEAIWKGFLKVTDEGRSTPHTTGFQSLSRDMGLVAKGGEGGHGTECCYCGPVTRLFSSCDVLQTRTGKYGKGSGVPNRIHLSFPVPIDCVLAGYMEFLNESLLLVVTPLWNLPFLIEAAPLICFDQTEEPGREGLRFPSWWPSWTAPREPAAAVSTRVIVNILAS